MLVGARIARIYSVLGPGIPLDAHYAASSFLSQALAGGPVVVKDGAIRSYLHPKDLATALLTILAHGDGEPYDVGGEEPITVADLGRRIAQQAGVECFMAEPLPTDVYLPDLTRLHRLGWRQTIGLDSMIADTLESLRVRA
jgi:dTDP-glucose 4,6-dehydratase